MDMIKFEEKIVNCDIMWDTSEERIQRHRKFATSFDFKAQCLRNQLDII